MKGEKLKKFEEFKRKQSEKQQRRQEEKERIEGLSEPVENVQMPTYGGKEPGSAKNKNI